MAGSSYGDGASISGSVVVNDESSSESDFRVESDSEDEALYLDAGANTLYINKGATGFTTVIKNNNEEVIRVGANGLIINEYGHASNDLRVESDSNTHMLFVDAGNNRVGIGTDTPSATLEVSGTLKITGADDPAMLVLDDQDAAAQIGRAHVGYVGSSDFAAFAHQDRATTTDYCISQRSNGQTDVNTAAGTNMTFRVSSATRMQLNSSGYLSIGSNYAPGTYKLAVEGGALVEGNDVRIRINGDTDSHPGLELAENGTRKWIIYNDYVTDNLDFKTDSNIRMSIAQGGTVGIGTTSPKVPLDVYEMGGLILGYTMLNNDNATGNASYQLTTSYAVPTSDWKITFVAPASGKVEIQFFCYLASAAAGNDYVYLGLSDNSTYNQLAPTHENQIWEPDEDDNCTVTHCWYVAGLTAGTSYTYYIGTKGTSTAHYWYYGGTNSGEQAPLIIKALSLPNTVHTD